MRARAHTHTHTHAHTRVRAYLYRSLKSVSTHLSSFCMPGCAHTQIMQTWQSSERWDLGSAPPQTFFLSLGR